MRTWPEIKSVLADPTRLRAAIYWRLSSPFRRVGALGARSTVRAKAGVSAMKASLRSVANRLLPPETRRRVDLWRTVLSGGWTHYRGGETPRDAHVALIDLFIESRGTANDRLAKLVGLAHPPYRLPSASGVLGDLSQADLAKIQSQLETDGYYVFENCLSEDFCDRLMNRALEAECMILGDEVWSKGLRGRYDRAKPIATKYLLTEDDTTDIPEVQELVSDPSIITVAQNYLRSKPIFSGISLWWSAAVTGAPDSQAAQMFHWDMERIKWIRFFIYVTDVTLDTGPHCFVKGTHRTGAIPDSLLKLGYVRHTDETIVSAYGRERYLEFVGRRGTIIAEDSRGFHKGMEPRQGDRLLLAFELSNTTFGANKRHLIRNIHVPRFGQFAQQCPRVYSNFDFVPGVLRS